MSEKEFSIALAGGGTLAAGKLRLRGEERRARSSTTSRSRADGLKEKKTPLIDAGKSRDLKVALKPGKYKFYCTVPGHEQAGMKVEVTVR